MIITITIIIMESGLELSLHYTPYNRVSTAMDIMNSELNGTVLNDEADYRNMRWAEDLANAILQQGGEVDVS
jgi:hypothetical protein